jgi:hypothetical protein
VPGLENCHAEAFTLPVIAMVIITILNDGCMITISGDYVTPEVMAALGYRRFRFHGMDCSYLTDRHAGPHLGKNQDKIFVKAGDRVFQTTRQMLEAAIEMEQFIKTQDAELAFFGDGLMQETALQLKEMA